jgi:uncharacterized protein YjbJ (UPF0337 family)
MRARALKACHALPRQHQEDIAMDKNRVAGAAKAAKGNIKEAIGKVTGDAKLQADGRADQAEGKLQNAIGGVMDAARDSLKKK